MRERRDVSNRYHVEPIGLQRPNRGFSSTTGSLNKNIYALYAMIMGPFRSILRGNLCCKWSSFSTTFEIHASRTGPTEHVALLVGYGDNRIVER